jgi:hypothetical protein
MTEHTQMALLKEWEMTERKQAQPTRTPARRRKVHYQPTELDYEILKYVMDYYILTAWQLIALHYSPTSATRAKEKLQLLSGNKKDEDGQPTSERYLHRDGLAKKTAGNPTYVYFLATDGINYLRSNGYPSLTRRFRPSEAGELSYNAVLHALNVNDILIAGRNLPKAAADIRLESWMHDFDLQKQPAKVSYERRLTDARGGGISDEHVKIVPDGMLDFRMRLVNSEKERRRVILTEIDRDTETKIDEFKKKISAYVQYALPGGAFEEQFGRANKRVAWIVTKGGERRMNNIRKWCEDELLEQGLEHEFNLFRFTSVEQVTEVSKTTDEVKKREALAIDPKTFFLSPIWYKPFQEEPDTLLWKP